MIARSIAVCLVLVLAWHLLMPRLTRAYHRIPGQQRANYFRAQEFVHKAAPDARVIVGSSMSDRLDARVLGEEYVRLTFPGGGPLTGLEILSRTGRVPKELWIESNLVVRDADEALVKDATAAWRMKLREVSPVFLEEGRPSAFGVGFLRAAFGKVAKGVPLLEGNPAAGKGGLDASVLEGVMVENRKHLSKVPDPRDLEARVERFGRQVDDLMAKGSRCVFFEMPIDASLRGLAEPAAIRAAMEKRFPKDRYLWLDLTREEAWQTTDGIHLTPPEVAEVIRRIHAFSGKS